MFLLRLLVVAPFVGALVGGGGATLMGRLSSRRPIREEYQSLYGIGLVLLAFVGGEVIGGSGFIAAFGAGLAVNRVNHDLCDCFLSFGQNLAEVLLLVAFVLFGAMLSGAPRRDGDGPPAWPSRWRCCSSSGRWPSASRSRRGARCSRARPGW